MYGSTGERKQTLVALKSFERSLILIGY